MGSGRKVSTKAPTGKGKTRPRSKARATPQQYDPDESARDFMRQLAARPPSEISYLDLVRFCVLRLTEEMSDGTQVQMVREIRESMKAHDEVLKAHGAKRYVHYIVRVDPDAPEDTPPLPELPGVEPDAD